MEQFYEGEGRKFGQIQLLTLCKSSWTDRSVQILHNISQTPSCWLVGEHLSGVFRRSYFFTSTNENQPAKPTVTPCFSSTQLPRSFRNSTACCSLAFLVTVVESLLLTTWFSSRFKSCKVNVFDVLLQCERGRGTAFLWNIKYIIKVYQSTMFN